MEMQKFEAVIEALLFACGNQVHIEKIALAINKDLINTKALLQEIMNKYEKEKRGIQIIQINESYQMCTNPDYFPYIKNILNNKPKKVLSNALIETLAIIAYKQPITKSEIEDIRGVSVGHSINKLIEYSLVCEKGRLNAPGKPILFGTTDEFLKHFNFNNISELPETPNNKEDLFKEAIEEIDGNL